MTGTFCSQTQLIVDVAVESAASLPLRLGAERTDSEEEQVGGKEDAVFTGWQRRLRSSPKLRKFSEQNPTVASGLAETATQAKILFNANRSP